MAYSYFHNGFMLINSTGNTSSTKGSYLLDLTDIEISHDNEVLELNPIQANGVTEYVGPIKSTWQGSASFYYSNTTGSTSVSTSGSSGDTKLLSGNSKVINPKQLLALAKAKNIKYPFWLKISDTHYEKGMIIIKNMKFSSTSNAQWTGTIEFQGTGELVTQ